MSALFDVFGFLAVVAKALDLVAQSVLLGSVSFALFVVAPLAGASVSPVRADAGAAGGVYARTRSVTRVAAIATAVTAVLSTLVTAAALAASLGLGWREIAGSTFVEAGATRALAALVIAGTVWLPGATGTGARWLAAAAALVVLGAAVADTHAIARIAGSTTLLAATAAHMLGAGIWLGGLPCFWIVLREADTPVAAAAGRRFSVVAACGVALIVVGVIAFAVFYIGSAHAVYGTSYGAMAGTKGVLLAMLLALGLANYRAVHRAHYDERATRRIARFVELEIAVGMAVLIAAASITSATPSVDVTDRVTLRELAARFAPAVPRMTSPPHAALAAAEAPGSAARTVEDRRWSEYNHHWAGVLVVLIGIAGLAQRSGRARWASHWPLLFLLLAVFVLLRADPEVWPMGPIGPVASLHDPEVVQHRLFALLIVAFAVFEWGVRTGRIASPALARVFPVVTAAGAALLLLHSHAVGDVKEQLLIEMTHLPIAVLGVVAGCARWLELAAPRHEGRFAGYVWPLAFVLIGLLLLDYREA